MSRRLRVYGWSETRGGKSVRCIMAATSQKELSELTKMSLYYIRGWVEETGNDVEIAVATAKPRTLFWKASHSNEAPKEAEKP